MEQPNLNLADATPAPGLPALDGWAAIAPFHPDPRQMARNRIVSVERSDPASAAFDMLRTRAWRTLRDNRWTAIAVTSPTPGCGKSTVAANLAISFARERDLRVILVDLDLRRPRIARMLGLESPWSIEQFLREECRVEEFFQRYSENLAVGASRDGLGFPAELLHDQRTALVFKRLRQALRPDVVIYDLPPMLTTDDYAGFAANADCTLLVVAAEVSRTAEIDLCEQELSEDGKLLGVVLNKCRYAAGPYGSYEP